MQKFENRVNSVNKGGVQFRNSQGKFDATVRIKTDDGIETVNVRKNEKGGRRAGSNYFKDEKCLAVASLICKGVSLETAVSSIYAHNGIVKNTAKKTYRPEIVGHVWGSEYAFRVHGGKLQRMAKNAKHATPDWEDCYTVTGKVPGVILIKVAESNRSQSPNGYDTEKVNVERNANITAWKAGRA